MSVPAQSGPSPLTGCPRCGRRAGSVGEEWALRQELGVSWLVAGAGGPRSAVFCRGCAPAGPVIDLECGVCRDGPLLVSDHVEGGVGVGVALLADVGVRGWLVGQGWTLDPALVCPRCRPVQLRARS